MDKIQITHLLQNGQIVKGTVYNQVQLSAKFQIWAREYGLSDAESLACWIADKDESKITYFQSIENADNFATQGFQKLEGITIPDLSEIQ